MYPYVHLYTGRRVVAGQSFCWYGIGCVCRCVCRGTNTPNHPSGDFAQAPRGGRRTGDMTLLFRAGWQACACARPHAWAAIVCACACVRVRARARARARACVRASQALGCTPGRCATIYMCADRRVRCQAAGPSVNIYVYVRTGPAMSRCPDVPLPACPPAYVLRVTCLLACRCAMLRYLVS
jgi:hypothetical protein